MRSCYLAQQAPPVNVLPPVDVNGGATSDVWSMKGHDHASILLTLGVTGGASTVTVEECSAADGSGATAIAFHYHAEAEEAGDTLSVRQTATAAGFATSTNNAIMYVIELDAAELSDGFPFVRVALSDPGSPTLAAAVAFLSGGRYTSDQAPTVLT